MRADPITVHFNDLPSQVGSPPRRSVRQSIGRGLLKRCPNCGRGKILTRYLKVVPTCPSCGEDLSHQRADDAPPYLTIVAVGHIVVPAILLVETRWPLSTALNLAIWLPMTLILSLLLLPVMKGAVVGLQWALRMHGFDDKDDAGFDFDADDTDGGTFRSP